MFLQIVEHEVHWKMEHHILVILFLFEPDEIKIIVGLHVCHDFMWVIKIILIMHVCNVDFDSGLIDDQ